MLRLHIRIHLLNSNFWWRHNFCKQRYRINSPPSNTSFIWHEHRHWNHHFCVDCCFWYNLTHQFGSDSDLMIQSEPYFPTQFDPDYWYDSTTSARISLTIFDLAQLSDSIILICNTLCIIELQVSILVQWLVTKGNPLGVSSRISLSGSRLQAALGLHPL